MLINMKQNKAQEPIQLPRHYPGKSSFALVLLLTGVILLGAVTYRKETKPTCMFLSKTNSAEYANGGLNNQSVLSLATSLGAKDPIQECWGGISNATSIDGPEAAIRIVGSGTAALARIGCTKSSTDDAANGDWVGIVHDDFGNKDKVTGYYYGDGNKCNPGSMVSVVFTAKDSNGSNELYIVYYGGYH